MYYTVIKHDGHLRTRGKRRQHEPQASVFCISRVFSNVRSVYSVIHSFLFFFYKNIVFPGQAEYSYFSADFRLKIFLYYSYIIGCDISVLEFIGISIKLLQVFGI